MTTTASAEPTRWNLTNVYSRLEGEDYQRAWRQLETWIKQLEDLMALEKIGPRGPAPNQVDDALVKLAENLIEQTNRIANLRETLDAFIYAFVSTDSYDEVAAREQSRLQTLDTRRWQLHVLLQGWLGKLQGLLGELERRSETLRSHGFFMREQARQSKFLMSPEMEELASELCLDGAIPFSKLQGSVTSQLKVPFARNGKEELLPITVVHNFCYDADAGIRERAYHAEIAGWKSIRTSVAACLNAVKGTALTLARRRGRQSVLEVSLEQNRIDRQTLDALLGAIHDSQGTFHRYLAAKAKRLGKDRLPWWDLFAPAGNAHRVFSWSEAREFLVTHLGAFSGELGDFVDRAFEKEWIDGAPRDGKRGGAFCMPVVGVEESRILANFDGSFEQVSTLAHELGHAFHNECQKGLPPLLRGTPSTLAETASTFCETLIAEAAMQDASPEERLLMLEAQLIGATQVCLDIRSRFLFESAVFENRQKSELSPDEFCQLMLAAQKETYSIAVDEATYHPYMWLWKPHYYQHEENFYNFPYAFGQLFALGLYAEYRRRGDDFIGKYKELLRRTGQDWAAPLAEKFGVDIRQKEFWLRSLSVVADQVARYEKM